MAEAQNMSVPKGKGEEPGWHPLPLLESQPGSSTSGEGLPRLVEDLEGLREKATVQLALAERDMDRRYYVVPRRAARGAGG